MLALLVSHAGEIVSKREILERVWPGLFVDEANLRAQIAHLRSALGDQPDNPSYIKNVRGRGYIFTAAIGRTNSHSVVATQDANVGAQRRLPRRGQRLVGREQALDDVLSLASARPLITIVGPGGLGKTVLAIEVGHRLAPQFRGDVCFVDLGSLTAADLAMPTVASALGYSIPADDILAGLVTNLADRNVLLILDCCEHVLDEVCQLTSALFHNAPGVCILATSRESLRADGEHVYLLKSLELPVNKDWISADEAKAASSVQLFMERASSRGYIGELLDDNAPAIAEICRQLDGNPLAIEMVASRLATYGFSGLLDAVSGRSVLGWPGRRDDARHQTLQTTLDWSFRMLSPEEQRVLARLSVLSGPFSVMDAEAVACVGEEESWAIVRAVEDLADKSLLAMSTTEGHHSFRMLDVTRIYAGIKLAEGREGRVVAQRHAEWCSDLLATLYPVQHDGRPFDRRSAERAVGNIRSALEWCFSPDGDSENGIKLAARASKMLLDLSMYGECVRWCRTALSRIARNEPVALQQLELQENLALSLMYTAGNDERVGDAINRGLEMATALGERQTELHLLAGYNLYHTRRGDFPSALSAAERFATVAESARDSAAIVAADWMLGSTHHLIGHEVRGEEFLERGFSGAEALRERPIRYFGFDHECRAAISRAWIAWLRGRPETSIFFAKRALDTAAALNHPVSMCIAYLYISWTLLWLRDLDWVQEVADLLAGLAKKHQLKPYLTGSVALRGELLLARGQVDDAVDVLGGVLASLRDDRQYIVLTPTLRAYAEGLAQAGQAVQADEIITDLVHRAESGTPTYLLPELIRTRGDVCLARGLDGAQEAETHYNKAIAQARINGALGWELRAATSLARLWIRNSCHQEAHGLLHRTLSHFTEGDATADVIEARSLLNEGYWAANSDGPIR